MSDQPQPQIIPYEPQPQVTSDGPQPVTLARPPPGIPYTDELVGLTQYKVDYARFGQIADESNLWIVRYDDPTFTGDKYNSGQAYTRSREAIKWVIENHPTDWLIQSYRVRTEEKKDEMDQWMWFNKKMLEIREVCDENKEWFGLWYEGMSPWEISYNCKYLHRRE